MIQRSLTVLICVVLVLSMTQSSLAQQANDLQSKAQEFLKNYKPPQPTAQAPTETPEQSWQNSFLQQQTFGLRSGTPRVNVMPSYSTSTTYANALAGSPITVWGNVHDGTAPYRYILDYGDGTVDSGDVTDPHFIGNAHTYATAGTKTMTLTVRDAANVIDFDQATIKVYSSSTTQININIGIEKGLVYLYQTQYASGYWYDASDALASTGAALLCFEENGHRPTNSYNSDIYAEYVRAGLDYLLNNATSMSISAQSAGNPDVNGDGLGAYITYSTYGNGIANLAVMAAHSDTNAMHLDTIKTGALTGWTYYKYIRNMADQWMYAQTEGSAIYRGGWHYSINTANYGSMDNSTTQWGALDLHAAEVLGFEVPSWVKTELAVTLSQSQNANGGFSYMDNYSWLNVTKTAAGIGSLVLTGATTATYSVDTAMGYINTHWADAYDGNNWTGPLNGNLYAMYGVAKAMRTINGGAGNQFIRGHDWYAEYADHLLNNASWKQNSNGSWPRNASYYPSAAMGDPLNSSLAILVLTKGVIVAPPVAVIAPISSRPSNTAFFVDGASSYHQDPNKQILQYLWDWDAADGVNFTTPDATGQKPLNPGYAGLGLHTITLRVIDNSNPALTNDVTATVAINDTANHPPIAVAIPPGGAANYAGRVGVPILLDGSHSYDPDSPNDSVVAYNWDTNGDGIFGDATTSSATVVFNDVYNGEVGLRVYDSHGDSSTNNAHVTIVASRSDLSVVSFTSDPYYISVGDSLHLVATFKNNDTSNTNANNVLVRFYDGDPLTTGNQMGGNYNVDLPIGGTATIDTKIALPAMSNGSREVFVFLDPTYLVDEWDESNNVSGSDIEVGTWLTLRGMKFNDLDGDSLRDEGEPGIQGWIIRRDLEISTKTDANGYYEFIGVPAGTHTVSEEQDTAWTQTYPASGFYTINSEVDSVITGLDFGNHLIPVTGISGTKFNDLNGNGVKDNGEPGLANWQIYVSGAAAETTLTDGAGNYSFILPNSGNYTVREIQQEGWTQTTTNPSAIDYVVGQPVSGVNFGNYEEASISGWKFGDTNGNGVYDDSESGLAGWSIKATKGETVKSTTTDANGFYSFSFLPSETGTWVISEVQQPGWIQIAPANGTYSIVVQSGTAAGHTDFGNAQAGSISGQKFEDVAGDSSTAGDGTLNGWVIKLMQDTVVVAMDTTSGAGNYEFANLIPGTYSISEVQQSDWTVTYPASGSYTVALGAGQNLTGKDFGNFKLGSISGMKFNDTNGDSVKGVAESGLANWQIVLTKGQQSDTTLTDSLGNFSFSGLFAGSYQLTEVQQLGWYGTVPASGSYSVDVVSGTVSTDKNFGNFMYGSISGTKFFDRDSSGTQNCTCEGPLQGFKIVLSGANIASDTVLTDSVGGFSFTNVPAGLYTISEALSALWRQTVPANGAPHTVSVSSGFDTAGLVFGNFHLLDTGKFRTFILSDYNKASRATQKSGFIRLPTAGNVRDTVFARKGFGLDTPSDSGYLRVGVKRPDSALVYGWFWHKWTVYKKSAVKTWIYNTKIWGLKRDPKTKLKVPRNPANYLGIIGEQVTETYFGNAGNHLTVELTTLKTNVAASDLNITPQGFGDLIYISRNGGPDSVFSGKSIRKIIADCDTSLTMGRKIVKVSASLAETTYRCDKAHLNVLDSVISKINLEFRSAAVKLDTISTKPLKIPGVKALYKVAYLVRDTAYSTPLAHFDANYASEEDQPLEFRLDQNYPNPFNPTTTLQFMLSVPSKVTLKVYNLLGQEVATVLNNEDMDGGTQAIEFDASSFSSGVYFYRLEANGVDEEGVKQSFTSVKKMMMIK